MSDNEKIEHLLSIIEGTANMLRGMTIDPSINDTVKNAMWMKIEELDTIIKEYIE